jgi:hypothetical protein
MAKMINVYEFLWENPKERGDLNDLGVDGIKRI